MTPKAWRLILFLLVVSVLLPTTAARGGENPQEIQLYRVELRRAHANLKSPRPVSAGKPVSAAAAEDPPPTLDTAITCECNQTCGPVFTCEGTGGETCDGVSPTCNGMNTCMGIETCMGAHTCEGGYTCDGQPTCRGHPTCYIAITCVGKYTCDLTPTCDGGETCYGVWPCDGAVRHASRDFFRRGKVDGPICSKARGHSSHSDSLQIRPDRGHAGSRWVWAVCLLMLGATIVPPIQSDRNGRRRRGS